MNSSDIPAILMGSGCLFLCLAWGIATVINAFKVK